MSISNGVTKFTTRNFVEKRAATCRLAMLALEMGDALRPAIPEGPVKT